MTKLGYALLLPALLLALTACSGGGQLAAVMCEDFAEQRVGSTLTFWEPGQYQITGEAPQWTVHHGFVEPGGGRTEFLCTVTQDGDQWHLDGMTTSRLTTPMEWAAEVAAAGFE